MSKELLDLNIEKFNEYEILEGSTEQLEEIVSVNSEVFRGMYEQDPYSFDQYAERLKDLQPKIFIAKIGDRIVGNSISYKKDNSLYIWIMGVLKEHRNKGIATELFENNEKFARDNKCESITVKVYNVSKEMLSALLSRNYEIVDVEKSETSTKYNAIHLKLKIGL